MEMIRCESVRQMALFELDLLFAAESGWTEKPKEKAR
jgi:hypothetical protein